MPCVRPSTSIATHVNPLKPQELEVFVIEAAERLNLLQERDEHARVVLIGPWEVDVLEVEHQAFAISRSVDPSLRGAEKAARLGHLQFWVSWFG